MTNVKRHFCYDLGSHLECWRNLYLYMSAWSVTSKKRKTVSKFQEANRGHRNGTRTEHFLYYRNKVMDVLDKNSMHGN